MTIVLRSVKGSNLTAAEVDGNFTDLNGRVTTLETTPPTPNEIANVDVTDGLLTITMDDATVWGPFALPVTSFRVRDAWEALTEYNYYDIVYVEGDGVYFVAKAHTSPAAFSAEHAVGGVLVYIKLMSDITPPINMLVTTEATEARTLVADDRGYYIRFTSDASGGCTLTLEPDSVYDFPVGTQIHFRQSGAALVTLDFDSAITVNAKAGCDFTTVEEGSVCTLIKVGANEWDFFGDHGFVSV